MEFFNSNIESIVADQKTTVILWLVVLKSHSVGLEYKPRFCENYFLNYSVCVCQNIVARKCIHAERIV